MVAICHGASASPKPGYGETVSMGSAGLAELITKFIPDGWAIALVVGLAGITYDLVTLCSNEPPDLPTISAAEAEAFLTLSDLGLAASAAGKLKDLVTYYAWHQFCDCNDASAPILSTATPPANWTPPSTVTQRTTQEQTAAPCFVYTHDLTFPASGDAGVDYNAIPGEVDPSAIAGTGWKIIPVPNPSWVRVTMTMDPGPDAGSTGFAIRIDAAATHSSTNHTIAATGVTIEGTTQIGDFTGFNTGDLVWRFFYVTGGTPSVPGHYKVEIWCNGDRPNSVQSACCPPDPTLAVQVERILSLVTLIQRQAVPFAYIPGATHTALSGSGEIAVQGLLGAKIMPTTVPSQYGSALGHPDEAWLESWFNWGNADGWAERIFLRTSPQVSLPAAAGQYTKIGYSLAPGIVIDLVELVREA